MDTTKDRYSDAFARGQLYKVLSRSFLYPTNEVYDFIGSPEYAGTLSEFRPSGPDSGEIRPMITTICDFLKTWHQRVDRETLEYEYNRLFAHLGSAKCPPYETEYGYDNVFQKTQAMADIGGFYRAYQLDAADVNTERVDFISTELEFMSFLATSEAYAHQHGNQDQLDICTDTQRKFLTAHLGRWAGVFVEVLILTTKVDYYRLLGRLTRAFFDDEAKKLGVTLEKVSGSNNETAKSPSPFDCDGCLPQDSRTAQTIRRYHNDQ